MNTGVQDAYNLSWKLGAVLGGAPSALLDSYEAERRPIAEGVLATSTDAGRFLFGRGPLLRVARGLLISLLEVPVVKRVGEAAGRGQ